MSRGKTIKDLVIETCIAEGGFPSYEKLTFLVKGQFPTSRWQKTHYDWYKSKIKTGKIQVSGIPGERKLESDRRNIGVQKARMSKIEFRELAKAHPVRPSELDQVRSLAVELLSFLNEPATQESLEAAHVLGASSSTIQAIMLDEARRLGFHSERTGLFASYASRRIRPDYFRLIGQSGILMEVERGKILANNMDLLDLWKCHICTEADYLFLVLPKFRPTERQTNESIFARVRDRLETFFQPQNAINVEAVFLFGY